MAEFPTGYVVRSPATRDAAAIADVVQALDVADFGEPDFSEQDLLDDWMRPRFELLRDSWVLNGPTGRVIGYAYVWEAQPGREIEGDAFVLPEYSGRGLGSQFLDLMETRAREICGGRQLSMGVFASSANEEQAEPLGTTGVHSQPFGPADADRSESSDRRRVGRAAGGCDPAVRAGGRGRGARGVARRVRVARSVLVASDGGVAPESLRPPGVRSEPVEGRGRSTERSSAPSWSSMSARPVTCRRSGSAPRRAGGGLVPRSSEQPSGRCGIGARCERSCRSMPMPSPGCSRSTRPGACGSTNATTSSPSPSPDPPSPGCRRVGAGALARFQASSGGFGGQSRGGLGGKMSMWLMWSVLP